MNAIQPAKAFYVIPTKTGVKRSPNVLLQTNTRVLNKGELVNVLRDSTRTLSQLAERLETYLTGQDRVFMRDVGLVADLSFLKAYGSLYIYGDDQANPGNMIRSTALLDFLHLIRNNNASAMTRAVSDSVIYNDTIYTLAGVIDLGGRHNHFSQNGKPLAVFEENRLIWGYRCNECGSDLPEEERAWHENHPGCPLKNKAAVMESNGLVRAEFGLGMAARMAGVQSHLVPARHDVWVEPWVVEAAKLFEHQEGYAGLTLEDFLRKSRPASAASAVQKETP